MVAALIQITQGLNTDIAGRAVLGDAVSGDVVVTNANNTDVVSWTITLLSAPVGSATAPGVKGTGVSNTPMASFAVDGTPGCYRIQLSVSDGVVTDTDIRNFGIVRPEDGVILPSLGDPEAPKTKPNEFNFGGQNRGWMGDDTYRMLDWVMKKEDPPIPPVGLPEVLDTDASADDLRIEDLGAPLLQTDALHARQLAYQNLPYGCAGLSDPVQTANLGSLNGFRGLAWRPDGLRFYTLSFNNKLVVEFAVGRPWEVSTATATGVTLNFDPQFDSASKLVFSVDGTHLYIADAEADMHVWQYNLATAWSLSTATYFANVDVNPITTGSGSSIQISEGGSVLFVSNNLTIYQFSLSTPFNISTATYDSVSYSAGASGVWGMAVVPDGALVTGGTAGKRLIISRFGADAPLLEEFLLETPWDLSSIVETGIKRPAEAGEQLVSFAFCNDGLLFTNLSFDEGDDIISLRRVAAPASLTSNGLRFEYEAATSAPPGSGCFRFNGASTALYVDNLNMDGVDIHYLLAPLSSGLVTFYDPTLATQRVFRIDAVTSQTGYTEFTGVVLSTTGSFYPTWCYSTSFDLGNLPLSPQFVSQASGSGHYRLRPAPDAAYEITGVTTSTTVNNDFTVPEDNAVVHVTVEVLAKKASGTPLYEKVSSKAMYHRIAGTLTLDGYDAGQRIGSGLSEVTMSVNAGLVRVAWTNSTGVTVNYRTKIGFAYEDLL